MRARFEAACRVAGRLIESGIRVFSPIAHNIPILRAAGMRSGWQVWSEFDLEVLSRCDRLIVLMLDGWDRSSGVQAEIAFAKAHGIPCIYITEETLHDLMPA